MSVVLRPKATEGFMASINAECPDCGKRFVAPATLAGKRVRCRGCGSTLTLPAAAAAPDVQLGFRDDEQWNNPSIGDKPRAVPGSARAAPGSVIDDTDPGPTPPTAEDTGFSPVNEPDAPAPANPDPASFRSREPSAADALRSAVAASRGPGTPTPSPDALPHSAEGTARPALVRSTWFWHPQVVLLDRWLPRVTVVVGLLWVAMSMASNAPGQPAWVWLSRTAVALLLYTLLAVPLAHVGLRMAAGAARRQMPRAATWRTFASFIPAMTLAVVIWNAGGGWSAMVIFGLILGLAVAGAMLLLLFRLEPVETAPYTGYGAGGFVLGLLVAGALIHVANLVTVRIITNAPQRPPTLPTESPLWSYVAWVEPEKVADAKPAVVAPRPPVATTARTPAPTPTATVPAPTPTAPPTPAPIAQTDSPPARPPETGIFGTPVAPRDPVRTEPTLPPRSAEGARFSTSGVVTAEAPIDLGGAFGAVLRPPAPSARSVLIYRGRTGDDTRLDSYDATTWARNAVVPFSEPATAGSPTGAFTGDPLTSYAVSPDGKFVARLSRVPRPEIQVFPADNLMRLERRIPVDPATNPTLLGFFGDTRLAWQTTGPRGVEVRAADLASVAWGERSISLDRLAGPVAFHPNGRQFAVAARSASGGTAGLHLLRVYNFEAPALPPADARVASIDRGIDVAPTGLALSPDGRSLAAFYPVGGGQLAIFSGGTGAPWQPVADPFFASSPVGPRPAAFVGSALEFFPGGRYLLLYGDAILDAQTGTLIDRLAVPQVVAARVTADDTVDLVLRGTDGSLRVVRLTLDPAKLATKANESKTPGAAPR